MNSNLDFGYPWWLSYLHVPVVLVAGALLALAVWRHWPRWSLFLFAIVLIWSSAGLLIMRFGLNASGVGTLPTEAFLRDGRGRVLDIGAGTGRSSIMVLEARPQATLVASDLFGASFDQHFGPGADPQSRLLSNLRAAGVADRASIEKADMRQLPFPDASFDGVVTAYAMDHVNRDGSRKSLAEAARVLKPGGDFLLMVVEKEAWGTIAFGPLMMHGGTRGGQWWTESAKEAGLQVLESGTRPLTFYLLARRP